MIDGQEDSNDKREITKDTSSCRIMYRFLNLTNATV